MLALDFFTETLDSRSKAYKVLKERKDKHKILYEVK